MNDVVVTRDLQLTNKQLCCKSRRVMMLTGIPLAS